MTTDSVKETSQEQRLNIYLRLDSVPNIGIKSLYDTAKFHQCTLTDIVNLSSPQLQQSGWKDQQISALKSPSTQTYKRIENALQWLSQSTQHHFVPLCSTAYPCHLKELARPPLFLFAYGNLDFIHTPQLAMVGTRSPSQYAKEVVDDLIADLTRTTQLTITSGLALGIDGLCHRASLHHGLPTIAVLGCGIDVIYPKRHRALYQDIAENGLIVSEFVPGTAPHASLFPRRNRIISGLSEGVVVVEAKIKSGSLVTTKYALEQNKEVFAIPSAIYNPNAQGTHFLIKAGAKLTESAQDIIDELPHLAKSLLNAPVEQKSIKQTLATEPLLDSVSYSATSVDLIAKRTGMPISDVLTKLLQYELRGIVASTPEGYVKLRG
ncbi:DNA-processing protein DprA [Glaciecola sp. XM2]|uniref:DNA-processing protein DprA n=1 Tax=Glaciecola sp. XM2 TaxID=1914931 RepID=UPI001BDE972A|nr:DNA-processing protein DprA [Glaciecola sp. XM2]MBT1451608.1 DNA-processing protein DprA [Glaciecola sp. XM2]